MRKAIHKRKTAIKLNDLTDMNRGVEPFAKLTGDETSFKVGYKTLHGRWKCVDIRDPEVVAEIRDQADAWLENHPDYDNEG